MITGMSGEEKKRSKRRYHEFEGRSRSHSPEEKRRRKEERTEKRRSESEGSRSSSPDARRNKKSRKHEKERKREERRSPERDGSRSSSPNDQRERKSRKHERERKREAKRRRRSHSRSRSRSPESDGSRSSSSDDGRERKSKKHEKGKKGEESREERRKRKELLKALETPEEKRQRRLAKKEAKERKRREEMGWDQEYLGYTNADNPFGDQNLLDKFVWQKKLDETASKMQLSKKELERREKLRQEETKSELEKVKKRRIEREREREAREEEMTLLQRLREAEMFKEWEDQEDKFHLEQAMLRSKLRIESGRAKPIDLLAKYINTSEEDLDIEVQEPYHLLKGLNIVDLEDLLEDITVYCELEKDTHLEYWKDMIIIAEDEVQKLRKLEQQGSGHSGGGGAERRGGINTAVSADVTAIFKGKTHGQLLALEEQIDKKINSADAGTDVGYWESLLQQLKAHMARARLRDRHQAMLRKKLFKLRQEQAEQFGIAGTPLFPSAAGASVKEEEEEEEEGEGEEVQGEEGEGEEVQGEEGEGEEVQGEEGEGEEVQGEEGEGEVREEEVKLKELQPQQETSSEPGPSGMGEEPETLIAEEDLLRQAYDDYETGTYSPKLLKVADIEEELIVDSEEDASRRASDRERVLSGHKVVDNYSDIQMVRTVGTDGKAEEEYSINNEVSLGDQNPIWKEKYRPRKPRFFNRVHTGFEWNKYNQTHYDTDNPPPKIVQGYKFNIFYPDLIDKRRTPTYTLTPCEDNEDFAILRFHAGPPYEDIGFKIVNREWEYSWKHGFKSQFNNNILQLWFRFKRNRYRR